MPRSARVKSATGVYHVIMKGIDGSELFLQNADYRRFIGLMREVKEECGFLLHAFCLMDNHVHFLIEESGGPLCEAFQKLELRYAGWFNFKYGRLGHLFMNRYKSFPVDELRYYRTVLRYICQNPVKAGLCSHVWEYRWSSAGPAGTGEARGLVDFERVAALCEVEDVLRYLDEVPAEIPGRLSGHGKMTDTVLKERVAALMHGGGSAALSGDIICKEGAPQGAGAGDGGSGGVSGSLRGQAFLALPHAVQTGFVRSVIRDGAGIRQLSRVLGVSRYRMTLLAEGR